MVTKSGSVSESSSVGVVGLVVVLLVCSSLDVFESKVVTFSPSLTGDSKSTIAFSLFFSSYSMDILPVAGTCRRILSAFPLLPTSSLASLKSISLITSLYASVVVVTSMVLDAGWIFVVLSVLVLVPG